jgi:uncharacterized protein (TIGR03435 family)
MVRAVLFLLSAGAAFAQALPNFEVASVKPSAPGGRGGIVRMLPGNQTYIANNVPLRLIMTVAFTVTDRQITGGPDWINTEPYDITAKADRRCTTDELHDMLARLLEERFQMKIRREKREMPVWALVVDKSGPKLTEHDAADLDHPPFGPGPNGRGTSGRNVNMNYFAFFLSRLLDRNVVDRTGLAKNYDLTLDFVRDNLPPRPDGAGAGEPQRPEGPSIHTALREQLGLRLESAKGPVEFLVIEKAERPTAN